MNQNQTIDSVAPIFFERVADLSIDHADLGPLGCIARHISLAAREGILPAVLVDLASQSYKTTDAESSIKQLVDAGFAEALDSDSERLYITPKAIELISEADQRNEKIKAHVPKTDTPPTRLFGQALIDEVISPNTDITVGVQAFIVRRLMEIGFAVPKEKVLSFFAFPDMLEPPASVAVENLFEDQVLVEIPGGIWLHPDFQQQLRTSKGVPPPAKKVLEASITVCGLSMTYREAIDLVEVMEKFFMMTPFGFGELDPHSKDFSMTYRGVVFDRKTAMQLGDEIRRSHVFVGSSFPTHGPKGPGRMGNYYRVIDREQRAFLRDQDRFQRSREARFGGHAYGVHEGPTTGPKF